MRKREQVQLIEIIDKIIAVLTVLEEKNLEKEGLLPVLRECIEALEMIESVIDADGAEERKHIYKDILHTIKIQLVHCIEDLSGEKKISSAFFQELSSNCQWLSSELAKEKLKKVIMFMPYKASMWDCMETVWDSACKDSGCKVIVMPIPYFDRNPDNSFGEMHFEAKLMPKYVQITHYEDVDLEELKPDVIYFHYPYDEYNKVTSVDPSYYSTELKKYTNCLVYLSYSIPGVYKSIEDSASFCRTKGMLNADIVVAQSEVHKYLLNQNGVPEKNIAVLGNPKLDYVLKHVKDVEIPELWKKKIGNREAVLICLSLGSFLNWERQGCIELYDRIIDTIIHKYGKAVIFRPHPLLESTIESMRPWRKEEYRKFIAKWKNTEGFVFDTLADTMPAIAASYCMFSDYSSLCFSYMVTGKPVGILVYSGAWLDLEVKLPEDYYYALDYRGCSLVKINLWLHRNEEIFAEYKEKYLNETWHDDERKEQQIVDWLVDLYMGNILEGKNIKKQEQMRRMEMSVVNIDGTSGEQIHYYVMNYCESKRKKG